MGLFRERLLEQRILYLERKIENSEKRIESYRAKLFNSRVGHYRMRGRRERKFRLSSLLTRPVELAAPIVFKPIVWLNTFLGPFVRGFVIGAFITAIAAASYVPSLTPFVSAIGQFLHGTVYFVLVTVAGATGGLLYATGRGVLKPPKFSKESLDLGTVTDLLSGVAGAYVIFLILPFGAGSATNIVEYIRVVATGLVGGYAGRSLVDVIREKILDQAKGASLHGSATITSTQQQIDAEQAKLSSSRVGPTLPPATQETSTVPTDTIEKIEVEVDIEVEDDTNKR